MLRAKAVPQTLTTALADVPCGAVMLTSFLGAGFGAVQSRDATWDICRCMLIACFMSLAVCPMCRLTCAQCIHDLSLYSGQLRTQTGADFPL